MLGMPGWRVGSHVLLTNQVSENATTVCLITAASPCTYIIYTSTGRGGQQGGWLGWVELGGGRLSYGKLTSNCVWPCGETNTAVRGELMPQRALMTTCSDAPMTR